MLGNNIQEEWYTSNIYMQEYVISTIISEDFLRNSLSLPVLNNNGHYIVFHATRLDVTTLKMDRGYPRTTDTVFGGVPSDVHDVFLYKGKYLNSFSHYLKYFKKFSTSYMSI